MTPEQELQRAEQARQIRETPIVAETLDAMEREITEAWSACPARDVEGRDWMWRQIVATRKFRDILRGTMESGKVALHRIKEKESLAQRALKVIRR